MKTLLVVIATLLSGIAVSSAAPRTTADGKTYVEIVKACGADWRASDAKKAVAKGEGRDAWQAYRRECVAKAGWSKAK